MMASAVPLGELKDFAEAAGAKIGALCKLYEFLDESYTYYFSGHERKNAECLSIPVEEFGSIIHGTGFGSDVICKVYKSSVITRGHAVHPCRRMRRKP